MTGHQDEGAMDRERFESKVPAAPLSEMDRNELLRLAREAIAAYLTRGEIPSPETESKFLLEQRGVFVSLHTRGTGALRGCLGEFQARRPLLESVTGMAVAAATRDPRFPAVTSAELPDLQIEISALTPLLPIRPEQIRVGQHGLMIAREGKKGLLLPQVAVQYGWDREEFLGNLCLKAGLGKEAWQAAGTELLAFETEVWAET